VHACQAHDQAIVQYFVITNFVPSAARSSNLPCMPPAATSPASVLPLVLHAGQPCAKASRTTVRVSAVATVPGQTRSPASTGSVGALSSSSKGRSRSNSSSSSSGRVGTAQAATAVAAVEQQQEQQHPYHQYSVQQKLGPGTKAMHMAFLLAPPLHLQPAMLQQ
jgi:hypothetical protein